MKPFKIAFFDLDWTLYDHNSGGYVESGIKAIKQAQKKGIKVFLCSARPYYSLKGIGAFDLGVKWDGFIGSCGATAKVGNKFVRKQLIPPHDVRHLIFTAKRRGLTMEVVSCYKSNLIASPNEYWKRYHKIFADVDIGTKPYYGGQVTALLLFSTEETDEALAKENPNLKFFRFCPYGVDIMKHDHEKGAAIKDILDFYGFTKDDAISFGDDFQDISMKSQSRIFVCMGNGREEVKKEADYVTSRIEKNGLAKAMKRFGLIDHL